MTEEARRRALGALHTTLRTLSKEVPHEEFLEIAAEMSQVTGSTRVWDWAQWEADPETGVPGGLPGGLAGQR